jgi:hypothetical protein
MTEQKAKHLKQCPPQIWLQPLHTQKLELEEKGILYGQKPFVSIYFAYASPTTLQPATW